MTSNNLLHAPKTFSQTHIVGKKLSEQRTVRPFNLIQKTKQLKEQSTNSSQNDASDVEHVRYLDKDIQWYQSDHFFINGLQGPRESRKMVSLSEAANHIDDIRELTSVPSSSYTKPSIHNKKSNSSSGMSADLASNRGESRSQVSSDRQQQRISSAVHSGHRSQSTTSQLHSTSSRTNKMNIETCDMGSAYSRSYDHGKVSTLSPHKVGSIKSMKFSKTIADALRTMEKIKDSEAIEASDAMMDTYRELKIIVQEKKDMLQSLCQDELKVRDNACHFES